MKNFSFIQKYSLLSTIVLSVSACNDSFLDRTPTNDLNDEAYWNTSSDLEAYTNGIYNEAASNGTYKFMVGFHSDAYSVKVVGPYSMEAMSDNFATMDASQTWASAVAAGIENQPSGNPNYGSWSWTLLRRINVFLANYERATGVTEIVRNRYAGEALFFRAWFYLYMVQTYGDVPLIIKPLETNSEELYGARTPRKEVMQQVLTDINAACSYLPEENWGENRLTKAAALALKARISLYEGTYRKYHNLGDETEFLNACVSACEELMGMGYSIYNTGNPQSDYTALFTTDDLSTNSEVIFYRKYAEGLKRHRMCGYTVNLRNGGTKDFVDDFLCIDHDGVARPVALSLDYSNDTPEQEFANRDPRLGQTFLAPGNDAAKALFIDAANANRTFPRIGNMEGWPTLTGYHAIKYYIREQDKKGFNAETQDYPLFRYAEVLLNYAEAKAELGQCDQAILDKTINLLRDRAGMPHLNANPEMDPKYANYGISSLLVEIRRERRVELSFEYLRYQDLMRWAWGEKLKERVLGMRLEDADFNDARYEGGITKGGSADAGQNPVYVFKASDGKQYIDAYENTNYATARRSFDPKKDYLRPLPSSAISKNTNLEQNYGWTTGLADDK
ncbi:RagB/SusD family nutrient uptake outer membrane protein [uncultured Bacteroides sp.]|uniref:RagB/SusD family nutrient uptake outer membrane protein n=1 Tax=uncultured Bacteroides sp. TaxID=162156 RepID=UPI002676DB31|nr:RagB/SusD family nutrient uptake outer membrane protein [uncultured Bacteroides sp.]